MKTITVSLDDDTYRRACIRADRMQTSLAALVRQFLFELAGDERSAERLRHEERALRERIVGFLASDRSARDECHERGA